MNFIIRQARIEDASSIAFVQVESWKTTYAGIVPDDYLASMNQEVRAEAWRKLLNDGATAIFVAENAFGVFGFVSGGKLRDTIAGYDAELYAIYLLQREQKQGVGKMLLRKLAERLHAQGFTALITWVLAKNLSVNFYERVGGAPVAQKEIEIGDAPLTEIAFGWKDLNDLI